MGKEILLKPDEEGVYHLEMPSIEEKAETDDNPKDTEVAELERVKVLEDISKFEIANIPFGMAALGGASALIGLEVADGFLGAVKDDAGNVNVSSLLGRGALAWVVESRTVKGWLGANACHFAAAFIALDTLRQLIPIDTWLSDMLGKIGIGGGSAIKPTRKGKGSVVDQAQKVATDYYAGLKR